MSQALRECLRARRGQIEKLLDRVGHAAQSSNAVEAVQLMVEAEGLIEQLLDSEEQLLTPIYAHTAKSSAPLKNDHEGMRAAARRALQLLERGDVNAFADEAQILMAKIATHGHREDELLKAGHLRDGDPEHEALVARFVQLLRF